MYDEVMTIMRRKVKTPKTLVNRIVNQKVVANLKTKRKELVEIQDDLQNNFKMLKESVIKGRTALAMFNGRTERMSHELAEKVVDKGETDLFNMADDIKVLAQTIKSIDEIHKKVEQSSSTEFKASIVEDYLSSNFGNSKKIEIKANLETVVRETKALQHSVNALLDLKAGK